MRVIRVFSTFIIPHAVQDVKEKEPPYRREAYNKKAVPEGTAFLFGNYCFAISTRRAYFALAFSSDLAKSSFALSGNACVRRA